MKTVARGEGPGVSHLRNLWIPVLLLPGGFLLLGAGVLLAALWSGAIYIATFSALVTGLWDGLALWRAQRAERRAADHASALIRAWAAIPFSDAAARRAFFPRLDGASNALDRAQARTARIRARIARRSHVAADFSPAPSSQNSGGVAADFSPATLPENKSADLKVAATQSQTPGPRFFVDGPGAIQ